jgi:thiamine-phosphate pyrophosphorylase
MAKPPSAPAPAPECRLYLITPPALPDLDAFAADLEEALSAGDVACLQIRLKDADRDTLARAVAVLAPIAETHDVAVILNDDPQLALELGLDGVHVGQDDMSCREARAILGPDAIVGVTCHDSRHLAMEAAEAGADYVAFGAFFPTGTKDAPTRTEPSILSIWQAAMETPCVAIGGITVGTCRLMAQAGADFVAISAGVWKHQDGPGMAVKACLREIEIGLKSRTAFSSN